MTNKTEHFDAVIVGAGFAGMYMLYRLRGLGLQAKVYDTASGVGGTWFWNRYPGARCDIESMQYSYSFSKELEQEWEWTERYATQGEILRYANHVADRFNLWPDMKFNSRVTAAHYVDSSERWQITIRQNNSDKTVTAQYCIMATGCLSSPNTPSFEGLDDFSGPCYHTGKWPHEEVDFSGQRVAVIGTGSSGIQSIPIIAAQAKHLTVFQRTPNYIVPAHNHPLAPQEQAEIKANYGALREKAKLTRNGVAYDLVEESALALSEEDRQRHYEQRWSDGGLPFAGSFPDLLLNAESNRTAAEFVRHKIYDIVKDPKVAELLTPTSTLGCKRLCVDTGYYETFNRDNVSLVDISQHGIEKISAQGPIVNGETFEVDTLVLATGFDAMTGALNKIDIRGKNSVRLMDKWQDGPQSYLGLMVADFPNLFTITGPGSPSVLSNMLGSIEFHVDWIANCIRHMQKHQFNYIEASKSAEENWVNIVNKVVDKTLYRTCNSWYVGANIPGKPRVFMPYPGVPPYVKKCTEIAQQGYTGFNMA